jgi:hypothetical protein
MKRIYPKNVKFDTDVPTLSCFAFIDHRSGIVIEGDTAVVSCEDIDLLKEEAFANLVAMLQDRKRKGQDATNILEEWGIK